MRLFVIGQAAFGEQVLARLLKDGAEVTGVSAPTHPPAGRPEPLRALAEQHHLPVITTRDLKKAETFESYAALKAELNVMAFVTDILPLNLLDHPKHKSIQYHPSLLPRHRGASAMNWAIIQGETKTGLTIFWPDKGIDTGPILLQREVEITPDDTLGTLYFNKLFPMGVEALAESVKLVQAGEAPSIVQPEAGATYEPICSPQHGGIHWGKPAREVYNLIRGCNPSPGAWAQLRGDKLSIFDSQLLPAGASAQPGEIVAVQNEGVTVALNGGVLLIKRMQRPGAAKVAAIDFASANGLRPGELFGGA